MKFEILTDINDVELIASQQSIRELARLNKMHREGRLRKLEGNAFVRLPSGRIRHVVAPLPEAVEQAVQQALASLLRAGDEGAAHHVS